MQEGHIYSMKFPQTSITKTELYFLPFKFVTKISKGYLLYFYGCGFFFENQPVNMQLYDTRIQLQDGAVDITNNYVDQIKNDLTFFKNNYLDKLNNPSDINKKHKIIRNIEDYIENDKNPLEFEYYDYEHYQYFKNINYIEYEIAFVNAPRFEQTVLAVSSYINEITNSELINFFLYKFNIERLFTGITPMTLYDNLLKESCKVSPPREYPDYIFAKYENLIGEIKASPVYLTTNLLNVSLKNESNCGQNTKETINDLGIEYVAKLRKLNNKELTSIKIIVYKNNPKLSKLYLKNISYIVCKGMIGENYINGDGTFEGSITSSHYLVYVIINDLYIIGFATLKINKVSKFIVAGNEIKHPINPSIKIKDGDCIYVDIICSYFKGLAPLMFNEVILNKKFHDTLTEYNLKSVVLRAVPKVYTYYAYKYGFTRTDTTGTYPIFYFNPSVTGLNRETKRYSEKKYLTDLFKRNNDHPIYTFKQFHEYLRDMNISEDLKNKIKIEVNKNGYRYKIFANDAEENGYIFSKSLSDEYVREMSPNTEVNNKYLRGKKRQEPNSQRNSQGNNNFAYEDPSNAINNTVNPVASRASRASRFVTVPDSSPIENIIDLKTNQEIQVVFLDTDNILKLFKGIIKIKTVTTEQIYTLNQRETNRKKNFRRYIFDTSINDPIYIDKENDAFLIVNIKFEDETVINNFRILNNYYFDKRTSTDLEEGRWTI